MIRAFRGIGWILMSLMIAMMVLTTLHYFGADTSNYFQPDIYIDRLTILRVHIAAGIVAVLAGPLQFVSGFRNKFRTVHRTLGKIYIVAVLISALLSLAVATTALGGLITQAGFSVLALCWAATTIMAYVKIRKRDIADHQRWMIRSFALSLAFVMLRIIFGTLQFGIGLDQVTSFQIVAWACWIPNLLIAELMLRRSNTVHPPISKT